MAELNERIEAWKCTVEHGLDDQLPSQEHLVRPIDSSNIGIMGRQIPLGDETQNKPIPGRWGTIKLLKPWLNVTDLALPSEPRNLGRH